MAINYFSPFILNPGRSSESGQVLCDCRAFGLPFCCRYCVLWQDEAATKRSESEQKRPGVAINSMKCEAS